MKMLRIIFWFLLLCMGFLAGVAWTSRANPDGVAETEDGKANLVSMETTMESANSPESETLTPSELATINLFQESAPSVCYITTTNRSYNFWTGDYAEVPSGNGSGFIWDRKGHIVTNYHVIQNSSSAQVTLADQSTFQATVVGTAPEKDLAVLRIEAPAGSLRPIPVGASNNLRVGQSVFAIGNPFGLDQTLTTGIVSALGREIKSVAGIPIRNVIQTDAAINPGNSGGPLLNTQGQLIGVNTAIYSPSGASAGIGFSIPVDVVRWVVPELISFGELRRPTLGIELAPEYLLQRAGIKGVLILRVSENGPAEKAGILPTRRDRNGRIVLGDIITGINKDPILSYSDLVLALEKYKAGDRVTVSFLRDDKAGQVEIELEAP
ncbi:MAG: trypsin-like peptidase domain-containing protein [Saprospiraceae bacterium]|nr:trypsin-like peptidase domain-containing protein [Saprospiraceae bacterium]MDP4999416.1 trypsin-like peptidase domain-containing protein [Saprospiraceae bacterium]